MIDLGLLALPTPLIPGSSVCLGVYRNDYNSTFLIVAASSAGGVCCKWIYI
jgi:hypothetical protein